MGFLVLTPKTFLTNASGATATGWYPVDWKYSGEQNRTLHISKTSGNAVTIETRVVDGAVAVTATSTTYATAAIGNFELILTKPFTDMRVRNVGSSGAATVVGLV